MPVSSLVISIEAPLTELLCSSATLSLSVASVTWATAAKENRDKTIARVRSCLKGIIFIYLRCLNRIVILRARNGKKEPEAGAGDLRLDHRFRPNLENIQSHPEQSLCPN